MDRILVKLSVCVLAAVACCAANQALGADPGLENEVSTLRARVAALESVISQEGAAQSEDVCWEDVSGEKFSFCMGGQVMGDWVLWTDQDASSVFLYGDQSDYVEFRRLRLFAAGCGYGVFDYKVELDFEPERGVVDDPAVAVRDVYVGAKDVPLLGYVRLGHFKEPFSLEESTDGRFLTFMERALPVQAFLEHEDFQANNPTDNRNVGIAAYNCSMDQRFTWAVGAFFQDVNENAKERVSDQQGIDIAVRGTWNPWYEANGRGVLHLGAGYTWTDDRDDAVRFRARPEVHEGPQWVDTGLMLSDQYSLANVEAALVYGPFSVQTEGFVVDLNGIGPQQDEEFYGCYVYGSYFLTGENRVYNRCTGTFGRVIPNTNFWLVKTCDGPCAGWGAWEVAARWSYVELFDGVAGNALAGQMNDVTLGVNWYWNPNMRMMFNYIHAFSDVPFLPDETNDGDILAMRLQVDF
jgi:phosphate-selective porin OprO/OprP